MIMVLVENGVYSLAISPDSGFVEITKNENDGKVSGGIGERTGISCGQILEKRPNGTALKWLVRQRALFGTTLNVFSSQ